MRLHFILGNKTFFNSLASSGFNFPANTRLNCFLLKAESNLFLSTWVSGIKVGTLIGFLLINCYKIIYSFVTFPSTSVTIFNKTSMKTSIEELNALLTLAFKEIISPAKMGSLKETLLIEAVTTTLPQCLCAKYWLFHPSTLVTYHQRVY